MIKPVAYLRLQLSGVVAIVREPHPLSSQKYVRLWNEAKLYLKKNKIYINIYDLQFYQYYIINIFYKKFNLKY